MSYIKGVKCTEATGKHTGRIVKHTGRVVKHPVMGVKRPVSAQKSAYTLKNIQ